MTVAQLIQRLSALAQEAEVEISLDVEGQQTCLTIVDVEAFAPGHIGSPICLHAGEFTRG